MAAYKNHEHYIDRTAGEAIERAKKKRKGYGKSRYPWGGRLTYRIGEVMGQELRILLHEK
ncbi:MAG TPA: hypothetical protein GXX75_05685 [Clostridiales bacterium]|nr:hypothetical protein [Clostridiales bacterium]